MSNMGIYVPSCDRYSTLESGVLRTASPELRGSIIYVVPEGQGEKYREALRSLQKKYAGVDYSGVVECPEKGIAKTRLWIGHHARNLCIDKFLMLDDDIQFFQRKSTDPNVANLLPILPAQVNVMVSTVEAALDKYAHVGISAREGNNHLNGSVLIEATFRAAQENTRTLRALAYRTADFLSCEHGRVEVMEDFDVNLQLLEKGLPNLNLATWAQDQKMTNAPGGCSSYRSQEVQTRSAERLAELHPGSVKLRQKENKTGGEFGSRTEVTIYWQKTFKNAAASHGK